MFDFAKEIAEAFPGETWKSLLGKQIVATPTEETYFISVSIKRWWGWGKVRDNSYPTFSISGVVCGVIIDIATEALYLFVEQPSTYGESLTEICFDEREGWTVSMDRDFDDTRFRGFMPVAPKLADQSLTAQE
jgi:hypothetical protein